MEELSFYDPDAWTLPAGRGDELSFYDPEAWGSAADDALPYVALDIHGNGSSDTWLYDVDGTGRPTVMLVDRDGDGQPDEQLLDLGGTGTWTPLEDLVGPFRQPAQLEGESYDAAKVLAKGAEYAQAAGAADTAAVLQRAADFFLNSSGAQPWHWELGGGT